MTKPVIRLAPGRAGWYDEASRLHLTIANPEAEIEKGTNITNIKKSIKRHSLLLVQGSLDNKDNEYIDNTKKLKKLIGKGKIELLFGKRMGYKKVKENEEVEDKEAEDKEVEDIPEEPTKPGKGEEDGERTEEDKVQDTEEDPKEAEDKDKTEKEKDNDNSMELTIKLANEIEEKIQNARAVSGVNNSIKLIEENAKDLKAAKKYDELMNLSLDRKIEIITSDIEKATLKEEEKITKAISELPKDKQAELTKKLDAQLKEERDAIVEAELEKIEKEAAAKKKADKEKADAKAREEAEAKEKADKEAEVEK